MNSLCNTFQLQAMRTWGLVKNNHNTPIHLREDGITALNLQELFQFNSNRFLVFDFTPHTEKKITGADWEWWFNQKKKFFGAAVQAKDLKDNYEYKIDKNNQYPQIRRLINYSIHYSVTPLYCFYNYWDRSTQTPVWPCPTVSFQQELWGCSLADAKNIASLFINNRLSLSDILPISLPWHCITCCPGINFGGAKGIATRACGIAKELRSKSIEINDNEDGDELPIGNIPEVEIRDSLPSRITTLMDLHNNGEGISKEIINEHWNEEPPDYVVINRNTD